LNASNIKPKKDKLSHQNIHSGYHGAYSFHILSKECATIRLALVQSNTKMIDGCARKLLEN
jgi:hypothetical protein